MRFPSLLLLVVIAGSMLAGEVPQTMKEALERFQIEGPKGWSYVQTSRSADRVIVESYDLSKPELLRWTLVSEDGKAPGDERALEYRQSKLRRSSAWNAPRIEKQIDPASCETLESGPERLRCRFKLRQDDLSDTAAKHMLVGFTLHLPTRTIELVEISNTGPFSPSFWISIERSRTLLHYSLPSRDRPSLLLGASMKIQGRAFWVKTIDQSMEITWTEHRFSGGPR